MTCTCGFAEGDGNAAPVLDVRCPQHGAGAAIAFGIMGMFEAVRANAPRVVERSYWVSELDGKQYYDCHCPGCGAYMKHMQAGVDEGTDNEWCGSCRCG